VPRSPPDRTSGRSSRVCRNWTVVRNIESASWPLSRICTPIDEMFPAAARAAGRAVVTENVADFAAERDLVLVFVLKRNLPAGGAQAAALARILDRWNRDHPDPYLGHHWPMID